jgi:type VI secretion system protein VasI
MKKSYYFPIILLAMISAGCGKKTMSEEELRLLVELRQDLQSTKKEIEESESPSVDSSNALAQIVQIKVETLKVNAALLDQRIHAIESGVTFKTVFYQRTEEPWQAKALADEIARLKSEVSLISTEASKATGALHNLLVATEARRNQTLALLEQRYLVAKYGLLIRPTVTDGAFGSELDKSITAAELEMCIQSDKQDETNACISVLARRHGLKVKHSEVIAYNKWIPSTYTDPFTDEQILSASLKAKPGSSRLGSEPILVLRCRNNKLDMFINWRISLKNYAQTQFRIGSEQASSSAWALSTDGRSAFYPADTVEAVRKIVNSDKVAASVAPSEESPVIAVFDVSEALSQLQEIKDKCPW